MKEDLSHYNPEGSALRILQLQMLDILVIVTDICDKHNIPYWISGGTLLGAEVHKGFIPWDDDIDMELLRSDYKKLMRILAKELPAHLYLQTPSEKYYPLPFAKVRDRNSVVYMKEEDVSRYKVKGYYIDIVPVECSYWWMKKMLDSLYGRAFRRIKKGEPFKSPKRFVEYSASLLLYPASKLLMGICRGVCAIAKPNNLVYTYGINAKHGQKTETILPTNRICFEGKEFSAPNKVHDYLYTQYKCDYTVIPPLEGRPQHFIKVEYL